MSSAGDKIQDLMAKTSAESAEEPLPDKTQNKLALTFLTSTPFSVDTPLSHQKYDILRTLNQAGAISPSHRLTCFEIAERLDGNGANENNFKRPLRELTKDGYLKSKSSRGGGYWFTAKGQFMADSL